MARAASGRAGRSRDSLAQTLCVGSDCSGACRRRCSYFCQNCICRRSGAAAVYRGARASAARTRRGQRLSLGSSRGVRRGVRLSVAALSCDGDSCAACVGGNCGGARVSFAALARRRGGGIFHRAARCGVRSGARALLAQIQECSHIRCIHAACEIVSPQRIG